MIQKVDHLTTGDLIVVAKGYNHQLVPARFLSASEQDGIIIAIHFSYIDAHGFPISDDLIYTRNSTQQRVYKITEDNLQTYKSEENESDRN